LIRYRKNNSWDIIKIKSILYTKQSVEEALNIYLIENKVNKDNKVIDIIETIPSGDEIIIQFAILNKEEK